MGEHNSVNISGDPSNPIATDSPTGLVRSADGARGDDGGMKGGVRVGAGDDPAFTPDNVPAITGKYTRHDGKTVYTLKDGLQLSHDQMVSLGYVEAREARDGALDANQEKPNEQQDVPQAEDYTPVVDPAEYQQTLATIGETLASLEGYTDAEGEFLNTAVQYVQGNGDFPDADLQNLAETFGVDVDTVRSVGDQMAGYAADQYFATAAEMGVDQSTATELITIALNDATAVRGAIQGDRTLIREFFKSHKR